MTRLDAVKFRLCGNYVRPTWDANVPRCDEDCPSFDGKRCELLGFQPEGICEPAVKAMAKALGKAAAK